MACEPSGQTLAPFLALACRRALAAPPPPPRPSSSPAAAAASERRARRPPPLGGLRRPAPALAPAPLRPAAPTPAPPSAEDSASYPGGRGWVVPQGWWQSWPCGGWAGRVGGPGRRAGVSRVCRGLACRVGGGGLRRRGGRPAGGWACDCVVEGACPAGRPSTGKDKSTASKNGADPEKESPRRRVLGAQRAGNVPAAAAASMAAAVAGGGWRRGVSLARGV